MAIEQTTPLGSYIRTYRERSGESVTSLATRVGIGKSHLSQIEKGKITLPGADARRRLAKILGISHLDLLVLAGEVTDDEIAGTGSEGIVFDKNDPRIEVANLLRLLRDDDVPAVCLMVERLAQRRKG